MVWYTSRKRRTQRKLYYAEHREEVLLKKKEEYRVNHPKLSGSAYHNKTTTEHQKGSSKRYYANYYARHREEILLKRKQRYHESRKAKGYTSREYSKKKSTLNSSEPAKSQEAKPRYFVKHRKGLVLRLQKLEVSKVPNEFDRKRRNLEQVIGKIVRDSDAHVQTMPVELHKGDEDVSQGTGVPLSNHLACKGGRNNAYKEADSVLTVFACRTKHFLQEEHISNVDFSDYKHDIVMVDSDSQIDASFLAKSQQRVDEMLTQLKTENSQTIRRDIVFCES